MADTDAIQLTVHHHGTPHTLDFLANATITDLSAALEDLLSIPPSHQKLMVTPKPGLLKPPFKDPELPLQTLTSRKVVLVGSTPSEIASLNAARNDGAFSRSQSPRSGRVQSAKPARRIDQQRAHEEALYTFTTLRPLPHLPNPGRSLEMLERLRADAGIKAAMRTHRWTVPLLTEMDPAAHTTHESRTLGLNRNGGEVIELRLRTDAYDGYRDYKGVRRTLCHELAHNVWGEHDSNFWALCRQVEAEVERGDWRSGGRALTDEEFYEPPAGGDDDGDHVDHGAWTGGEYVLGAGTPTGSQTGGGQTLSRREVLARAAEERMRKQRQMGHGGNGSSSP